MPDNDCICTMITWTSENFTFKMPISDRATITEIHFEYESTESLYSLYAQRNLDAHVTTAAVEITMVEVALLSVAAGFPCTEIRSF